MSAGVSATVSPADETRQIKNITLPYKPRKLSVGESTSRELFIFYSPRNERNVKVCEYLHLAMVLQLEFNPNVSAYVERPRKISVTPQLAIDLAFWVREKDGRERFWLAVPKSSTPGHSREGAALRDRARMSLAAERNDLQLSFVAEEELLTEARTIRNYFLLLPHVQSTRRIVDRVSILSAIQAYFTVQCRSSFRSLMTRLDRWSPDQVQAVAASMVHSGALMLDHTRPLTLDSMLEVNNDA
jgi:hypothetical protein